MATLIKTMPRVVDPGSATIQNNLFIKNGEAWTAGAFLRVDTSGLLVELATFAAATHGNIRAMALDTVTDPGNSTTAANVLLIADDTIFEGNMHHDTPSSAVATEAAIGQQYGLHVGNNNATTAVSVHNVDMEVKNTTNTCLQVTDIGSDYNPAENSTADVYGRVRFKILPSVIDGVAKS